MHRDSYGRFAADSKTGDNTRSVSCSKPLTLNPINPSL